MFHNIRILSEKHNVRVISFFENDSEREALRSAESICESVTGVPRLPKYLPHWFSLAPFLIHEFNTPEMREAIERDVRLRTPDVIQSEYLQMGQYRRKGVFSVLTLHEILSANARQAFARETDPLEKLRLFHRWMGMLQYEIAAVRKSDRAVTMTEEDADYVKSYLPRADIRAIPIGVDTYHFLPQAENPSAGLELLFVGNFRHTPNVEAVEFLHRYIHPHFPNAKLIIAGSNVPEHLKQFQGIVLTGYVADTRTLYKRPNTIVVAPLFSGTGQRVKLLEAFSMQMPVVTTALGGAGLRVRDRQEALLAESPQDFVAAIQRLIDSDGLRRSLGGNARKMVSEYFDWKVIGNQFHDVVEP